MSLLDETKYLIKKYGIKPHRPAGQNFLISEDVVDRIVEVADIKKDDVVIEIGPGLGFFTKELLARAKKVYAIELDKRLSNGLRDLQKSYKNLSVINKDILRINLNEIVENKKYKLVSNLPFNITSIVLRNFLSTFPKPESITLVVQKEIADRVTAKVGKMSILACSVQAFCDVEKISEIGKKNFMPIPKVESGIIKMTNIHDSVPGIGNEKVFFRIIKAGFSGKRKKLYNSLTAGLAMDKANVSKILSDSGIDGNVRAQDLSLENWKSLYKTINS